MRVDDLRRRGAERVGPGRPQRGDAAVEPPPRRLARAGASSANPPTVASPTERRCDAGGTPRTVSATSRGDAVEFERDQRAHAAGAALRAPSRTARARGTCSSRTPPDRRARDVDAPAHTMSDRGRQICEAASAAACALALPLAAAERIGDRPRSCARGRAARSVDPETLRREPFDRRGLRDVERLALRRRGRCRRSGGSSGATSRRASACASAPPSSPAADDGDLAASACAIVMAAWSRFAARSRWSPADRAASAWRSRARSSPTACRSRSPAAATRICRRRGRRSRAPGPAAVETLRADVRRYDDVERAIDATVGALRRPRHPRQQRRRRHLRRRRRR